MSAKTKDRDKCFIITPIGDDTDPIRRHIEGIIAASITPAIGEKYEIIVAHKISEPGSITKQVISEIYNSKLVIANLTNRNPNVMYELALRHAIGKPAIMIAEKGTSLPSDIIMQRTIFYQNDAKGVLELCEALKKAESEINFEQKGGPIYDVLGDISHDATMLTKAEQHDSDIREPLEYILQRLNRIEDSIASSRHRIIEREPNDHRFPRMTTIALNYEKLERICNVKALKNMLSKVSEVDPDAHVQDVINDTENKKLIVYILMTGLLAMPEIYKFFYKVLSDYGFKGLSPAEDCMRIPV